MFHARRVGRGIDLGTDDIVDRRCYLSDAGLPQLWRGQFLDLGLETGDPQLAGDAFEVVEDVANNVREAGFAADPVDQVGEEGAEKTPAIECGGIELG